MRQRKDRVECGQDGVGMVEGRLEVLLLRAVLVLRTVVVRRPAVPLTVRLLMAVDQTIVVPRFADLVEVHWRHQRNAGHTESHDGTHNPD